MPGAPADPPPRAAVDELLMPSDEDLLYEEELLRNPYSLKMWSRYIEARRSIAANRRYILYERALRALPGSYKVCHWPPRPGLRPGREQEAPCALLCS